MRGIREGLNMNDKLSKYETVIGLEVHAQLKTKSKMFCSCSTSVENRPNSQICPKCTGQPGTLPTINKTAVEMAIKTGLALHSSIQKQSVFARKNYFYPDLPKGYQISQHELPICLGGFVNISVGENNKKISIIRLHLEEDAGKSIHDQGHPEKSYIDFNRCGTPLVEIVSGPDMRSPKEGGEYLRKLRNILVYLDVCEGNLQEGNFRCDANVSIRPKGSKTFGTRTEVKNLNSFKAVERALAYEAERQAKLLDSGGKVIQETRLWNDASGKTEPMRSKEESHDYRYFPDPDLLPLEVDEKWIGQIKETLPELAEEKSNRFVKEYAIPEYDAKVITEDRALADYYEECISIYKEPKKISNWIMTELMRELKNDEKDLKDCPIPPKNLSSLIKMIDDGKISGKMAKDLFAEMYASGRPPDTIVKDMGLTQVSDTKVIEEAVDRVLANNPKQLEQYRSGKTALLGFFVGQVMKETKGQANPTVANEILKKKLG